MQPETKTCQNCKKDFTIEPEDFGFYKKINVPPPTFCSQCRLIRRLAFRNERSFYRRSCDKCGKSMISVFAPASGMTVYCSPCWWSDSWDGLEYAVDFNPNEPFLIQLNRLLHKVPVMNLYCVYTTLVNSDYTNMVSYLKDCYMVTYSDYCEKVIYGSFVNHTKDSLDNLMAEGCELCYETINCKQCYKTLFSVDCESCSNVWFSKNCVGCNDCFGCVNLRKKSYCFFNEQLTKGEYEKRIADFFPLSVEKIAKVQERARSSWGQFPQKYIHGWHNVGSTGDYLNDSKNAKDSFIGFDMEDCRFCTMITGKLTDAYDFTNFGLNSNLLYETLQAGNQVSQIKMSWWAITSCQNMEYALFVIGSRNIFGSVGLKKREYCILNKQYSREEYEKLRGVIIKQMNDLPYIDKEGRRYGYGEFLPIELSPFGYNETTAQDFFPITKESAEKSGYPWRELEARNYEITRAAKDLPIYIQDVRDDIMSEVVGCEHAGTCKESCSTAFKITAPELQFYKRIGLPLPRLCPQCRHVQRTTLRNPLMLWHRKCMNNNCPNEFETTYAPECSEIVYCESCYQQKVV